LRTPLAWIHLAHGRIRTLVALAGVSFTILLVFMQLGFYGSCRASATRMHELLAFDLALVSPHYVALEQAGGIPERRLRQATAVGAVAGAVGLHAGVALWRNAETGDRHKVLVLGFDPARSPFRLPEIEAQADRLARRDAALVDRVAHRSLGPIEPGTSIEVGGRAVRLVGDYAWGTGFNALGAVLVGEATYLALVDGASLDAIQIGLVRLRPGEEPRAAAARLRAALPGDVRVLTRAELMARERRYWVSRKPVGLMFTSGVAVAFLVGIVVLHQVLSSDVARNLREYATLKAIGYRTPRIQAVVLRQGFLLGALGFAPAAILAEALFRLLRRTTNLPIEMTLPRLAIVLLLSVGMCGLSGLLAVRRVTRADPADLF
jgi:putative ABC transport system permease protein